jgi:hypothetical protein
MACSHFAPTLPVCQLNTDTPSDDSPRDGDNPQDQDKVGPLAYQLPLFDLALYDGRPITLWEVPTPIEI